MTTTEAALRDALIVRLTAIVNEPDTGQHYNMKASLTRHDFRQIIAVLSQPPASSTVAQEGRDPVIRVTASLVAAISILRRAHEEHKEPRKIVASDKMFLQMLNDYEAAVEAARSSLSPSSGEPVKRIEDGHADTEGEAAEAWAHLNCPTCGGSGHIEDAHGKVSGEPASVAGEVPGWANQRLAKAYGLIGEVADEHSSEGDIWPMLKSALDAVEAADCKVGSGE